MDKSKFSFLKEVILLLAAVLAVDYYFFAGDRFWGVHPHPFFFIVLLVSVQYGTAQGLVSALIATATLVTGNLPAQTFSENIYDYILRTLHQPVIWIVSSVILGGFRDRYIEEREILKKKWDHSLKQVEIFSKACEVSDLERKRLETHVSGQSSFLLSLHQTALDIGAVGTEQVFDNILEITHRVTKSNKCSWYVLDNAVLESNSQLGWEIDAPYSRTFNALSPLFEQVIRHKRILSITNPEDEEILQGQGILAGPIIHPGTKKVFGMLKIEDMDFLSLNVQSLQTFKQLCEWLGTLLDREPDTQNETMVISSSANPNHELYSNNYFERLSQFLTLHNYKGAFNGQSIILRPPANFFLSEEVQQEIRTTINETMQTLLGEEVLFYEGKKNNSEFIVVVANISLEQAREISLGLINSLIDQRSDKINFSEFTVSIKSVGENSEPGPAIPK
jgi:hypothetical protein